jgi:transcriptional regulator with XRE-family HTH domain
VPLSCAGRCAPLGDLLPPLNFRKKLTVFLPPDPPPARRYVGEMIRHYRIKAGLTQRQFAGAIYCTDSLVAHIEAGRRTATPDWLARADAILQAEGLLLGATLLLANQRHIPGEHTHPELDIETPAALHYWAIHTIPDLLRIPDYARAMLRVHLPPLSGEDIEQALKVLADRQSLLDREPRPSLSYVLDEALLRRRVGGPDVMKRQLLQLLACADAPHLTLQVAPLDSEHYPGLDTATTIAETPGKATLAYLDIDRSTTVVDQPDEVAVLARHLALIRAHALPPRQSAALIRRLADEL